MLIETKEHRAATFTDQRQWTYNARLYENDEHKQKDSLADQRQWTRDASPHENDGHMTDRFADKR